MNKNFTNVARNKLIEEFNKYNIDISKKILIGVSGGPDSMWLLNLIKDFNIVVAHVNYNKRYDSHYDQKLVESFCQENDINLEVLSINHNNNLGNFQDEARKERYQFYKKIYEQYQCSYLLLAHQKDDFLETAIMQKQANRHPLYFGIKIQNQLYNMQIFRPMINLWWKDEIKEFCQQNSILFATDYTNDLPIYSRNKIRLSLKSHDKQSKENLFHEYLDKNLKLTKIANQVQIIYQNWEQTGFCCDFLRNLDFSLNYLIYYLIHRKYKNIKLTTNKINLINQFLLSENRSKVFKLNEKNYLIKKKNHLLFN
ncbi:tRNA lysidine(34) synthetase TilS [[Mycoplasma] phocae]|uniref:tRNA(Ile)-lysidine synthase n=1 Tax=[Mycoplasma] phocae TaxID=142651 RepID=A0A2Z5IQY2_9BACT|nr:tRNA lysidine(34) synthetase TilS [[Mycoplasma] phocae]AXE60984.1 tRNA lysidine(34) synthetase TilS [[Mycoplasma] phocae]